MKILRIIARLNIGGPARNVVLLAEGFSRTVLVCGEVGDSEGDMEYLAREKRIEPVVVPELNKELSFRNDWGAFWKIYRIICREMPDIVHTHTAKAGTLGRMAVGLVRAKQALQLQKKRVIVVHTFHGHVLHSYFGKVKTWFFIWIEKILAIFTDRIVTVSEALKKELVEKFRIAPEKKFSVVELGFELDELLKLPMKESGDVVNIGIVGRLVAVKNHKMLFRVISCLSKKIKQSQKAGTAPILCPRLIIIGDGELRGELERCVEEFGIKDIVEFKGWVKDLCEIYRDLDIVVLTSLNEGTPVSIIEAMASAKPVAATRVGGVSDIVKDGESGYLVELDDDDAFTERLLDLINDVGKRRRFGEYGRDLAMDRFSKDRLIRDMGRIYEKLLENR